MQGIYILLGTNLGDREENLLQARRLIGQRVGKVLRSSNVYATAAWGITEQPDFLNQVVIVETAMSPNDLLKALLQIEQDMGRVRIVKWGERIIDLDVLYYHDTILDTQDLKIPHVGIAERRFTLVPLVELSADAIHPVLGKSQRQLLAECPDVSEVKLFSSAVGR
ncbi:MAG TPA: 2-amino-4-hydroxy-6-hydroxymethyldihydropteridine diphosphokinase [Cytophagales bacterium]|nr:2-amino-4-hydroxy-6-hydroxymethyldihydropteridine diphosphokinase [Cytophagales bacterium]HAA20128.1 2-amino-4-hydroxy-6-hydroxymethyldihydropteridine diphosphokinase [Cytophagales bacterium]HAP64064.1 2-amino-4-hydroxy-6-hydroxymethyldihydropteridine diphosphokinase [Cytophagales bacterium]